jgi:hypothetical protein
MLYYQKYLKYKNKYLELKTKNQKGGNPEIIARMQSFKGDFVLVIGSSEHQQKYVNFSRLPENTDKMIISMDLNGEGTNNFKLDFNQEATWSLFESFNGRFSTIIFDFATDKFIRDNIDFDILLKIKNLLKIGGKFYKYYSFGKFFIPHDIPMTLHTYDFNDLHLNLIFEQFNSNIPPEIFDKLTKINTFKIYKSNYGFHCPDYNLVSQLEFKDPKDNSNKNTLIISLMPYLKSMYTFHNQLSYIHMLQQKYNYDVESHNNCDSYPFKNEIEPQRLLREQPYQFDICYIKCTKI